jgi:hypothetical protein
MAMRSFLLLGCCLLLTAGVHGQQKHALIIAVSDYPDPAKNGWKPLNASNDIGLVQSALSAQGFQDITVLKNSEADKKGIVAAITELTRRSAPGDIAFIHISSHGVQLEDDNGDEADGLDEAIVPYGAVYSYDPSEFSKYAPAYLRDDEFGDLVTVLCNKLGKQGDLLVVIDACHSGTGTRGDINEKNAPLVRGGHEPMVSGSFATGKKNPGHNGDFAEKSAVPLDNNAAAMTVIAGAQAGEKNYECWDDSPQPKPVGSLSYAFSKAMSSVESNLSYRSLFASIENIMLLKAPYQRPVMETSEADRRVFAGKFIAQKQYFTMLPGKGDNERVYINGGSIAGVSRGSVAGIFPIGTTDPAGATPIVSGKIDQVDNFTSSVLPDKPIKDLSRSGGWIFITEPAYEMEKAHLDIPEKNPGLKKIKEQLKQLSIISTDPPYDLELASGARPGWAVLKYKTSGASFGNAIRLDDTALMEMLIKQLKTFNKMRYLRAIEANQKELKADVRFFLLNNGSVDSALTRSRYMNGSLEIKEGDQVRLQVINTGDRSFYINIVDVQPDGIINPVLPNRSLEDVNGRLAPITADDCKLNRGDTLKILNAMTITMEPPYGDEVYKVFLSADRIDLEEILVTPDGQKRAGARGNAIPRIEEIFLDADKGHSGARGGDTKATSNQTGTIFSLPFRIRK